MRKYEKYKSSKEAVWYDSIPVNWVSTKMRKVFSERKEKVSDKDYPPLSVGKMGVVPQLDTAVKTDNGDNRKLKMMALLSCFVKVCDISICVWTYSMFALLSIIQKPPSCTKRIFSALLGSCNIPASILVWLWMCAFLSMVCQ